MTRKLKEENGVTTSLAAVIRSDFRRQAEMFGWKRVLVSEGFWFTVDFRIRTRLDQIRPRSLRGLLIALEYPIHKLIRTINHSSLSMGAKVGPGLLLAHFGGVWIDPGVVIGRDCTIFHQVTIAGRGRRSGESSGVPTIGDRVRIMPGAKVLGGITIGDDVRIGANAVVLEDVPAGALAVGNPARVIEPGA